MKAEAEYLVREHFFASCSRKGVRMSHCSDFLEAYMHGRAKEVTYVYNTHMTLTSLKDRIEASYTQEIGGYYYSKFKTTDKE
jgi:hypothetical protein